MTRCCQQCFLSKIKRINQAIRKKRTLLGKYKNWDTSDDKVDAYISGNSRFRREESKIMRKLMKRAYRLIEIMQIWSWNTCLHWDTEKLHSLLCHRNSKFVWHCFPVDRIFKQTYDIYNICYPFVWSFWFCETIFIDYFFIQKFIRNLVQIFHQPWMTISDSKPY